MKLGWQLAAVGTPFNDRGILDMVDLLHSLNIHHIQLSGQQAQRLDASGIDALLAANKRKGALTDMVTKVEDQIDGGASFAEAVAAAKLPVVTTPPVNSGGVARTDPAYKFPAGLDPALKAGFAMAIDDDPEIVTLPNETGYAVVSVDRIV